MKLAWDDGREILERYARINQLLNRPVYTDEDKNEIKDLRKLGLAKKDDGGKYALLPPGPGTAPPPPEGRRDRDRGDWPPELDRLGRA